MIINLLTINELLLIRGGGEPVKPIPQPRDRFDEEEQAQITDLSGAEETRKWVERLKKWFDRRF